MTLVELHKLCLELEESWQEGTRLQRLQQLRAALEACTDQRIAPKKLAGIIADTVDLPQFVAVTIAIERALGITTSDAELLHAPDSPQPKADTIPAGVMLENIRSAFNVGSLFRSADAFGLERVTLGGYTATPEHPSVSRTALGADRGVPWSHAARLETSVQEFQDKGHKIYALETDPQAEKVGEFSFQFPCHIVLGNERHGISKSLLETADTTIAIPMAGHKQSLNVGAAAAIVFFELRRQWCTN